jgi:ribosomal protein L37E
VSQVMGVLSALGFDSDARLFMRHYRWQVRAWRRHP